MSSAAIVIGTLRVYSAGPGIEISKNVNSVMKIICWDEIISKSKFDEYHQYLHRYISKPNKLGGYKVHFYLHQCRLACWVNFSADDIFKYFFLFFPENRPWYFMQIVSHLHEMSEPIFWEKWEKCHQFVVCWICPECDNVQLVQRVRWSCTWIFII